MYDKSPLIDLLPDDDDNNETAGSYKPGKKVRSYLAEIESQMDQLAEMIKTNNAKQEEIRALRDGVGNKLALLTSRLQSTLYPCIVSVGESRRRLNCEHALFSK